MAKLKPFAGGEEIIVEEESIGIKGEVGTPGDRGVCLKELREVVVTGITINEKQPWLQLGDPNPDVVVIIKPDGFTSCGKYKVVGGKWVKFK